MDDCATVIEERDAVGSNFVDADYIRGPFRRSQRSDSDRGAKEGDENAVLPFDALEACLDLGESGIDYGRW